MHIRDVISDVAIGGAILFVFVMLIALCFMSNKWDKISDKDWEEFCKMHMKEEQ